LILDGFADENLLATKKFKSYFDTIILNMPTKAKKYKKSIYFDDENIKDIEHENLTIIFYIDNTNNRYLLLSVIKK
jgi:hypothetical protein